MMRIVRNSLLFLLGSTAAASATATMDDYEYCIVGAGPAGIQLAHFLHKANSSNYVVLERHALAGSFFTEFPKQEHLISINKKYTGKSDKEFNLRHDWNSLLTETDGNVGTEKMFSDLTEDYWPHRSLMVDYLNQFAEFYDLNVHYQTSVRSVQKEEEEDGTFALSTDDDDTPDYTCHKLIWATGLPKPRKIENDVITPYHEILPTVEYTNKSVAIFGAGQSAFESARAIYKVSAFTMIFYRNEPKFAYNTHYVGDLRAINHEIIDSYNLKSLGKCFFMDF
jgi:cation diffusion facilitator CzcD-associated flavoprotein CzcO